MTPAEIKQLKRDVEVLAAVGRLYLDALDNDPDNEALTLVEALRVTEVREAVDRVEKPITFGVRNLMGYSISETTVRGDLFLDGEWKINVAINMGKFDNHSDLAQAVVESLRATPADIRGVDDDVVKPGSGYTLVVLEPRHYSVNYTGYRPVMVTL